jgi:hypothetical protein
MTNAHTRPARVATTALTAAVVLLAACEPSPPLPPIDTGGTPPTAADPGGVAVGSRWVRIQANLAVDDPADILATVRTARAAGADTVLFADTKIANWVGADYEQQWEERLIALRDGVRAEGMAFVVTTISVGYCTPILQRDPSLAASIPAEQMPLTVQGGVLVPTQTASLENGSFESATGNEPTGWGFQDAPGVSTFVDTTVAADGAASLRIENAAAANDARQARISTTLAVQPFQQYVLRYRFKADALDAGFIGPLVRGSGTDVHLTQQQHSLPNERGGRDYFQGADALTTDWSEIEIAFNSREFSEVDLMFGAWASDAGRMWIDAVTVEPAPTLNLVRRDALPVTLTTADGRTVQEGVDVEPISDPQLGQIEYPGNYDTYHDAPPITLAPGSSLQDGDTVLLSGYHAQLTMAGQVGCAWNEPGTFELMRTMHEQVATRLDPDGYLIDLEEVRTGGWEPTDAAYATSGAALSAHVQRVVSDARAVIGDAPLHLYGDMLDPTMNAVADFYQVKGTLDQSWVGVDPNEVRIVNWKERDALSERGRESVSHFAGLGFEQIAAGFYDADVATNHAQWQTALDGQPNIVGSMYTTWTEDFSQLEEFAALWWTE